jgi:FAD synthase
VEFVDFVRADMKFDNLEQLKQQIYKDKEIVIAGLTRNLFVK